MNNNDRRKTLFSIYEKKILFDAQTMAMSTDVIYHRLWLPLVTALTNCRGRASH